MLTLNEFIQKNNGKRIGNTPENTGQCTGAVMVWLKEKGAPHIWGHAKDLLINADRNSYEVIENTPTAIVQPGDVVVWKKEFNSTFGHTAIATKGSLNSFEVFEQNNPVGTGCRLKTYNNYAYVDGWLRPKSAIITQPIPQLPQITDQTRIPQIGNREVQSIRSELYDQIAQIADLKDQLKNCQNNQSSQSTFLTTLFESLRRLLGK